MTVYSILNNDVLFHIFSFLPLPSLGNTPFVSKQFFAVSRAPGLYIWHLKELQAHLPEIKTSGNSHEETLQIAKILCRQSLKPRKGSALADLEAVSLKRLLKERQNYCAFIEKPLHIPPHHVVVTFLNQIRECRCHHHILEFSYNWMKVYALDRYIHSQDLANILPNLTLKEQFDLIKFLYPIMNFPLTRFVKNGLDSKLKGVLTGYIQHHLNFVLGCKKLPRLGDIIRYACFMDPAMIAEFKPYLSNIHHFLNHYHGFGNQVEKVKATLEEFKMILDQKNLPSEELIRGAELCSYLVCQLVLMNRKPPYLLIFQPGFLRLVRPVFEIRAEQIERDLRVLTRKTLHRSTRSICLPPAKRQWLLFNPPLRGSV